MKKCNSLLITIGIFFVLSVLINILFAIDINGSEELPAWNFYVNLYNPNLKNSKITGIIYINGNAGWQNAKTMGICKGEGTYSNPYIIEDLIIDAGGYGSCIKIENSDVFFIIEDCTVSNCGFDEENAGIKLSNVQNSLLIKNQCLKNHGQGIYLEYSDYNIISENIVYHNYDGGITLRYSNYNKILGNTANSHDVDGIYLYYSNNNMIMRNIANGNFNKGIRLSHSNKNIVIGNTVLLNYAGGVYENNCEGNIFLFNFSAVNIMNIFLIISIIMILIYKNYKIRKSLDFNLKVFCKSLSSKNVRK
ncbi:MAG: right-handed parallel beta-helix repeat-containing protein [Candidatus Odinarchaeota archaeon]